MQPGQLAPLALSMPLRYIFIYPIIKALESVDLLHAINNSTSWAKAIKQQAAYKPHIRITVSDPPTVIHNFCRRTFLLRKGPKTMAVTNRPAASRRILMQSGISYSF